MKILLLVLLVVYIVSPLLRCIVHNFALVYFYGVKDTILYFKEKRWKRFNYYGIDMFIGMFGMGKSLSAIHRCTQIYETFGDKVRFISNMKLNYIPYEPLINFTQLVDLGEKETDYVGTVVVLDEIENLLSNRNFANFPLALMHMLTQQRKKRVYIVCTAQRFFMVDKLFRSITTNVYDCNKFWRFEHIKCYDAWDYENAVNSQLLQCNSNNWWFIRDKDYNAYDTNQMIMKGSAEDFISNDEALQRKGLDVVVNEQAIKKPNKRRVKRERVK